MAFQDENNGQRHWLPQGESLNEFNTPYYLSACFPDLFWNNKGDPSSPDCHGQLSWSAKLKHLSYFAFKKADGTFEWPCVKHPMFAYCALNRKQRHQILRCSKVFLNYPHKYEGLTVTDLKNMLKSVEEINL